MALSYTEAFAKYGAVLNNQQWSVSAFGRDGALVVSLWQDLIKRGEDRGTLIYEDRLSQWKGNDYGRNEFHRHLDVIKSTGVCIRLVIAHPVDADDAKFVGEIRDESKIKKTFSIREDLVGALVGFDGDALSIVFRRSV